MRTDAGQQGSALVIAVIVLAILAALGYAALDVADLNIFTAANDRDSREAFLHADSGVNFGLEVLEERIDQVESMFYDDAHNTWSATNVGTFNTTQYPPAPENPYFQQGSVATYVGAREFDRGLLPGFGLIIAAGYKGKAKSAATGSYVDYHIRAHREGQRQSVADVVMDWHHLN